MNRFRFLPPLGVVALIVGTLAAAVTRGTEIEAPSRKSEEALPDAAARLDLTGEVFLEPLSGSVDAVFAERPLFIEGRQRPHIPAEQIEEILPPEPPADLMPIEEIEEDIPAPLPDIALAGVVIAADSASALIRENLTGSEIWLRPGEMLGEWMLAEISQQGVRLERNGVEMTLQLFPHDLP